VAVVLVAARAAGALFQRLRQPPVIGEVVAGIALGPTLLGHWSQDLFPLSARPLLRMLAEVGLVCFMFLVGLELDLDELRGRGSRVASAVALSGTVVPFAFGLVLALALYPTHHQKSLLPFALFIGASMSITAFPVLARILIERGLYETPLGVVAMASAAGDDVLTWATLALVVAIVSATGGLSLPYIAALSALFAWLLVALVRPRLTRFADRPADTATLSVTVVGLFACAWLTSAVGVHEIFGAFVAGAIFPRGRLAREVEAKLDPVAVLLLPVFFVTTGLGVDIGRIGWEGAWQLGLVVVVACAGKVLGAGGAARATGVAGREALGLGVLMNTRGLTELVVVSIGRDLGVLDARLFTVLVLMAVATTVATGPLLDVIRPDPSLGAPAARRADQEDGGT
jgi:Kef-type K+ transport system membrane component KefB